MTVLFSCSATQHVACKCIATWYFVQHPLALLSLQCCLYCNFQPEVLEMDGGLALHVRLAGKSFMMPLLCHSWSSHSSFAGHQHC